MKTILSRAIILAISLAPAAPALAQSTATFSTPVKTADAKCSAAMSCQQRGPVAKLSDEQLEKLNSLKLKLKQDTAPKRAELETLRAQLRDTMSKASVDKSEALSLQAKINGLQADLANARLTMMVDAGAVFTPEQRQELRRMHLERSMHGVHHRGGHAGMQFHRGTKMQRFHQDKA